MYNNFSAFDDYRVCGWLDDGLMKKVSSTVRSVKASLKSAGLISMAAITLMITPTISIAHERIAFHSSIHGIADQMNDVSASVKRMTRDIDDQLARLNKISESDIDPRTLELAKLAFNAASSRGDGWNADWADRLASGSAD